jgi:hypothetical protein
MVGYLFNSVIEFNIYVDILNIVFYEITVILWKLSNLL